MIKNEIFKIAILLTISFAFLYSLPLFIDFIENSLKRKDNISAHKLINIFLYVMVTLISLIYILLIYYSNLGNFTLRILVLSISLLFGMVRFAEYDYQQVGKSSLFNMFSIICGITISLELFIALITK